MHKPPVPPFSSLRLTGGSPDDRARPDQNPLTEPNGSNPIDQGAFNSGHSGVSETRLNALLTLLSDGRPKSTKNIAKRTRIRLIQAHVDELKRRGVTIERKCRAIRGKHVFFYTMEGGADHG